MKALKIFTVILLCLAATLSLASCKRDTVGGEQSVEVVYYTVSFDSAGGSEVAPVRVVKDGKISAPTPPTRDGYMFDYWSLDGKEWDFDYSTVTADMTLTAQWIDAATVYSYTTVEGGIAITGTKRQFEQMSVPAVINGIDVVEIGEGAFAKLSADKVRKIVLAESVTRIGKDAFRECKDIEIVVKGALSAVGETAFLECNKLSAVTFADGLTAIAPQAFCGCESLSTVVLPASLEVVDENAFEDCIALKALTLYSALKEIRDGAFIGCDALENVYYKGTQAQFDAIRIDNNNNEFKSAKLHTEQVGA